MGTGLGRVVGSSLGGKLRLCPGSFPLGSPLHPQPAGPIRRISRWTRTGGVRRDQAPNEGCWAGRITLLTSLILWELNFHIGLKPRCPLCDPDQGSHGLEQTASSSCSLYR